MVDKELIEIWRNMLKPAISLWLLNTNYEEMGEQDKEEFERDFDEILDLALIGLKYKAQLSQERTKTHAETHACDLISTIQNGIKATDANDVYSCGMRNGMRWCISLIDDKEPLYENCPPAQPERKKGKWIQNDNGTYSCSLCHSWIPEEQYYYAQFCLYCGADMREAKVKYGDEDTLQGGLMSAT